MNDGALDAVMLMLPIRMLAAAGLVWTIAGVPGDARCSVPVLLPDRSFLSADLGIVQTSKTAWQISRAKFVQYPKENFLQLFAVFARGFTPLYEGDRVVGFLVNDVERIRFFRELGLRKGDVIRSFNDEPLVSMYELFLRQRFNSHTSIVIERRSQLIRQDYYFD